MAGSSHREPPREGPLRETLLTLVAPDSMETTPAKGQILGAEHELPQAYGHRHGKVVWRKPIGTDGGFESKTLAPLNR